MALEDIAKAITVTAELTGATLSGAAIAIMARELSAIHGEQEIMQALSRCRRELSRPLTSAAVFERLAGSDGRPTGDEAWAIALSAIDESETVAWSNETQAAFAVCRPVLESGDKIGARMAFKSAYDRIVAEARQRGERPVWSLSLGWDAEKRKTAVDAAAQSGMISLLHAQALLPAPKGAGIIGNMLLGGDSSDCGRGISDEIKDRCAALLSRLRKKNQ